MVITKRNSRKFVDWVDVVFELFKLYEEYKIRSFDDVHTSAFGEDFPFDEIDNTNDRWEFVNEFVDTLATDGKKGIINDWLPTWSEDDKSLNRSLSKEIDNLYRKHEL